jgi:hypothetical protein
MLTWVCRQFLKELHLHKSCTEYLHDFLEIIQSEILVVESNDPRDKTRISCANLNENLMDKLKMSESNPDYISKPAPWSRMKSERTKMEQNSKKPVEIKSTQPVAKSSYKCKPPAGGCWTAKCSYIQQLRWANDSMAI